MDGFLSMDRPLHGRFRTIKISTRWTEVDGFMNKRRIRWTVHPWAVHLMDRPPKDSLPHGWIWTTDHDNSWQVDGGGRPDGWTVHLMDENGRQTMGIFHRWTEVDGGRRQAVHLMDGFGRRTMIICPRWTEVDEKRPSTSWTDSADVPLNIYKCGRRWTG